VAQPGPRIKNELSDGIANARRITIDEINESGMKNTLAYFVTKLVMAVEQRSQTKVKLLTWEANPSRIKNEFSDGIANARRIT
jgi:hypothetical protein